MVETTQPSQEVWSHGATKDLVKGAGMHARTTDRVMTSLASFMGK